MGKKAMGLGRGMGDIIRDHSIDMGGKSSEISLDLIDANPFQPRKIFDAESFRQKNG